MTQGCTIWMTGLPGAGKTTLAKHIHHLLAMMDIAAVILDADEIRKTVHQHLGFSPEDRSRNVRLIGEMAYQIASNQSVAIVSCISPYEDDRNYVRLMHKDVPFYLVITFITRFTLIYR